MVVGRYTKLAKPQLLYFNIGHVKHVMFVENLVLRRGISTAILLLPVGPFLLSHDGLNALLKNDRELKSRCMDRREPRWISIWQPEQRALRTPTQQGWNNVADVLVEWKPADPTRGSSLPRADSIYLEVGFPNSTRDRKYGNRL